MIFQWSYLYVFLQSNLIEFLIFGFLYRCHLKLNQTFVLVTLSNAITHPLVFFGFMAQPWSYLTAIMAAEFFAITTEAGLHSRFGKMSLERTTAASLIANVVSWQLGPLLTYWIYLVDRT